MWLTSNPTEESETCDLWFELSFVCSIYLMQWTSFFTYLFYLRWRPVSLSPLFANRSVCLKPFLERRIAFISSSQSSSPFFESWNPCRLEVYHPSAHPSQQPSFQPWLKSPGLQKFPAESASGPRATGVTQQGWYSQSSNSSTRGRHRSTQRPRAEEWGECWLHSRQLSRVLHVWCPASGSPAHECLSHVAWAAYVDSAYDWTAAWFAFYSVLQNRIKLLKLRL